MKKRIVFLTLSLALLMQATSAFAGGPPSGVPPGPPDRTEVPFDAALSVLLGAGAVAAFRKVRSKANETQEVI